MAPVLLVRSETNSFENLLKNIKYDFQQNIESCVTPTTLQDITLAKIAINIWQKEGSFDEIKHFATSTVSEDDYFESQKHFKFDLSDSEVDEDWERRELHSTSIAKFKEKVLGKLSSLVLTIPCTDALEKMIKFVGEELENYFLSQSQVEGVPWNDAKIHWDNLVWTQQGTINYLKTAIQLIEHTDLNVKDKYVIACNACIEGKIRELLKKLPMSCIRDFLNDKSDEDPYHLTLFWTFYIRNERQKFSKFSKAESHAVYLINWSIKHRLEIAALYIWENFPDTNLENHLLDFAKHCKAFPGNENLALYFLQKANSVQLQEISVETSHYILHTVCNKVSRWHNLFASSAIYILQLFKKMEISEALQIVLLCWRENLLDLKEYQNIWKEFSLHFQLNNIKKLEQFYGKFFGSRMETEDTITTKIVLKMGTVPVKKKILLSCHGDEICLSLLSKGELDFFDEFLKEMLPMEKAITNFKEVLFPKISEDLCFELIGEEDYALLNQILNKFHKTKAKTSNFKSLLPLQDDSIIICKILKSDCLIVSDQLERLEKFLSWCFEGRAKDIGECKAFVFDLRKDNKTQQLFFKQVKTLLNRKNWELLGKYWRWIFFADGKNCRSQDEKLSHIKKILFLSADNEGCYWFKQFLSCSFTQQEIVELKLMESSKDLKFIVMKLLQHDKHSDVDELLNFCCTSDSEKIVEFKIEFMHTAGLVLLTNWSSCDNEDKIKKLFKWFNPTIESAKLLKEKFNTFIADRLANPWDRISWHHPIFHYEAELRKAKKIVYKNLDGLTPLSVECKANRCKTSDGKGQNQIPVDEKNQNENKCSTARKNKDTSSMLRATENTQVTSLLTSEQNKTQDTSLRRPPLRARRRLEPTNSTIQPLALDTSKCVPS